MKDSHLKLGVIDQTTSLFQSNPKHTGKIKIVLDTNNVAKLSTMDSSFDANWSLSDNLSMADNYSRFFVSANLNFLDIMDDEDNYNVADRRLSDEFDTQYFTDYQHGVRSTGRPNIFSYFAPIWISNGGLPRYFVIKRQKVNTKDNSKYINLKDAYREWETVRIVDLYASNLDETMRIHMDGSEYTHYPISTDYDTITVTGIDPTQSGVVKRSIDTRGFFIEERPIGEFDEIVNNLYRENNLISTNMFNLEFEFESSSDTLSTYAYVGYYCNVVDVVDVNDENISNVWDSDIKQGVPIWRSNDMLMNIIDIDGDLTTYQDWVNSDQKLTGEKLTIKMDRSRFDIFDGSDNRKLFMTLERNFSLGQSIGIKEDGVEKFKLYCADTNQNYTFKLEQDIWVTVGNLIKCLDNAVRINDCLNHSFEYNPETSTIIFNTNTKLNLVDVDLVLPNNMVSRSYSIDKDDVIISENIPNTLTADNTITMYVSDFESYGFDTFAKSDRVYIMVDDGEQQKIQTEVVAIIYDGLRVRIQFKDSWKLPNILDYKMTIEYYEKYNSTIGVVVPLPMAHFENKYDSDLYDVGDIDLAKYKQFLDNRITNNQFDSTSMTQSEAQEKVDEFFDGELPEDYETKFINDIDLTVSELSKSDNPYERYKEYDLQELATKNQMIKDIKFAAPTFNSANGISPINIGLGYNISNLESAVYTRDLSNKESQVMNWFLIGHQLPKYLQPDDIKYHKSYVNSHEFSLDTAIKLSDVDVDAYNRYLRHSFIDQDDRVTYINCWTEIVSNSDFSQEAIARFRGVEYGVNPVYVGYRFSIILVRSEDGQKKISEIINETYKTYTVLIEYPIGEQIVTSLGEGTGQDYHLDRALFYVRKDMVYLNTPTFNITKPMELTVGIEKDRLFQGTTVTNKAFVEFNSTTYYAVDIEFDGDVNNYFSSGNSTDFTLLDGSGTIDIEDVFEVVVDPNTGTYVWCGNASFNDDVNGNDVDFDLIVVQYTFPIAIFKQETITLNNKMKLVKVNVTQSFDTSEQRYLELVRYDLPELLSSLSVSVHSPKLFHMKRIYEPVTNSISHTLSESKNKYNLMLQRHSVDSAPIVEYIIRPCELRLYEQICTFQYSQTIKEYGIYKVGDDNTLRYDDNEGGAVHSVAGETITDRVEYDLTKLSIHDGFYRRYTNSKEYDNVNGKDRYNDHASLVSTIHHVNGFVIIGSGSPDRYGVVKFDVKMMIRNTLDSSNLNTLTQKQLDSITQYILNQTPRTIKFTNEFGITILADSDPTLGQGITLGKLVRRFRDRNNVNITITY